MLMNWLSASFAPMPKPAQGASRTASISRRTTRRKRPTGPIYPRVTINEARPGRTTTPAELEQLGLVAPNETIAPLSPVWRFHRSESEVTWADVEAVKLPFIVNGRGRRLYPNSKRALIIRATIALLKKQESAHLDKIFETLRTLEIDVTRSILGALLSEFKEIFYIYRGENGRCFRMVNE